MESLLFLYFSNVDVLITSNHFFVIGIKHPTKDSQKFITGIPRELVLILSVSFASENTDKKFILHLDSVCNLH